MEIGLGREESESRVLVLGSDLVISELLHKFRPSYHLQQSKQQPQNSKIKTQIGYVCIVGSVLS